MIKSDNVVSGVIPGVTFTILNTTGEDEQIALTLSSSRANLANALGDLVTNYNTVVDKVNAQIGESAGLLSGDWIIREVQGDLRALTTYAGSGAVKSLADLGIELDSTGKMSFNSTKFYSLSNSDLDAAFTYLGSSTTGLGSFASSFTQISDPIGGLIKTQQDNYDAADQRLSDQITALSERISRMQTSLSTQLQQADSLLAQLESQQVMLDASIQSLNLALFGKQNG